ncbi:unnamed protein product [Urochloa humidicola]
MDPLSVLRDYAARNELDKIIFSGDDILFGSDYTFPGNTPTAFSSKQSGRPYPLSAAVFLAQHHDLKHTDFIQAARLRRIPPVSLPDRKTFLDFLRFANNSLPSADPLLPSAFPPQEPHLLRPPSPLPEDPAAAAEPTTGKQILALERSFKDRNGLLDARGRDFLAAFQAALRRQDEQRKGGGKDAAPSSRNDSGAGSAALAKPKVVDRALGDGVVPIILVPSASQTLITIYNVKEFLEDGVFVPSDERMRATKGGKPESVTVQKKLIRAERVGAAGGAVSFEVRDKPASLKADDWGRVVAVFVLGKEWQFKDWPFKDHVEIFSRVIGFYVRFEDDSVEAAKVVKQWNVKIISISKNKRHQDRTAALEVWERLEEFMRGRT